MNIESSCYNHNKIQNQSFNEKINNRRYCLVIGQLDLRLKKRDSKNTWNGREKKFKLLLSQKPQMIGKFKIKHLKQNGINRNHINYKIKKIIWH